MVLKCELPLKGETTPVTCGRRARLSGAVAWSLCVAALLTSSLLVPANAQKAAAPSVGTVYAERKSITKTLDFIGRVDAIERVVVQARVKGYLEKVIFTEGATVKIGDPLYQIEKGTFQADVEDAQGALERAKAAKTLSAIQLQRKEELLAKQAGTEVARDEARAADEDAAGSILQAQAKLDQAHINLGYTDITSPIAGKISRTSVTAGNVVSPDSGPLTQIVSQDPMYVTFPVSQRELLQAQMNGRAAEIKDIKVRLRFPNGAMYQQEGAINFVDVSVNRATDTVIARATLPNPDGILIDGQLVGVVLEGGKPDERVLVPQAALIADQEGLYVFIVENGKAAVRRVKTGGESGADMVILEGLKGGEQVIVEGLQSIRAGQDVMATPLPVALNRS
jgi:membrane fusion protein (multidrug efflux system)